MNLLDTYWRLAVVGPKNVTASGQIYSSMRDAMDASVRLNLLREGTGRKPLNAVCRFSRRGNKLNTYLLQTNMPD